MKKYTQDEILDEAHKLAQMLAATDEIKHYQKVDTKIKQNKKIDLLTSQIKALQKQAVNFQAYNKTSALAEVEMEIDQLQAQLDGIPVVEEFKEMQYVVNDMLQFVTALIEKEVGKAIAPAVDTSLKDES